MSGTIFLLAGREAGAQTKQFNLYAKVENGRILCLTDLGITVSGEWTIQFTNHVDIKTGKVDRILVRENTPKHSGLYQNQMGKSPRDSL